MKSMFVRRLGTVLLAGTVVCGSVQMAAAASRNWAANKMGNWSDTSANGWGGSYPNGVGDAASYYANSVAATTQDVAGVVIGSLGNYANANSHWTIATNNSNNSLTFQCGAGTNALIQTSAAELTVYPNIVLNSPLSVIGSNESNIAYGGSFNLYGAITGAQDVTVYLSTGTAAGKGASLLINNLNNSGALYVTAKSNAANTALVTINTIGSNVTALTKTGSQSNPGDITGGWLWIGGGTLTGKVTAAGNLRIDKGAGGTLVISADNSASFLGKWGSGRDNNGTDWGVLQFASVNAMGGAATNINLGYAGMVALQPVYQPVLDHIDPATAGGAVVLTADCSSNLSFNVSGGTKVTLGSVGTNSYTGTMTPTNATYRLGGGGGTLILPNANTLTGANGVNLDGTYYSPSRAGTVRIANTNDYTGATAIYRSDFYGTSILETPYLANGGVPSGIGKSSSAAANLAFSGGVLRYTGTGAQSDRLFTLNWYGGNTGHTLDASGAGALQFANTGALAIGGNAKGPRVLVLSGSSTNDNTLTPVYADGTGNNLGTNALVKSGPGKWILSGADTYTGPTTITNGTLWVNGSISSTNPSVGGTSVFPGATLGGTGKVASAVTVTGGTVAPGAPMGTLTVGSVSINSNSTLAVQLNGPNQYSQLKSAGNVALSNCMLSVTVLGPVGGRDRYTIVNSTNGVVSGQFASGGLVTANNGAKFTITYGTTNVILSAPPGGTAVLFR